MKYQKKIIAAALNKSLDESKTVSLSYKMRAECRSDCEHIHGMLFPWILSWQESSGIQIDNENIPDTVTFNTNLQWALETEVQFSLKENSPSLNEVRWFIDKLTDCHVAAESLNIAANYSGERIDSEYMDMQLATPSRVFIGMAMRALMQSQERHESAAAQAVRTWRYLDEVITQNKEVTAG